MLALSLTILAKGGAEGINGQAFNPQYSNNGVSGLGIGLLWCIQFFIGFESAGTLGEETRNPRRNIPIALFFSVTVIGVFYVLGGWAAVTGYGIDNMNTLLNDPSPWITLGQTFWRPGIGWLISLTVLNSIFANLLSGVNAAVRVIYAMGREGLLPSFLGRTNSRHVPFVALTLYMVVSLALALGASFGLANEGGPLASYGFFGTLLGLGIILTYILINLALISFYWRKHRQEFNWLLHFVLPITASVIMILPIYGMALALNFLCSLVFCVLTDTHLYNIFRPLRHCLPCTCTAKQSRALHYVRLDSDRGCLCCRYSYSSTFLARCDGQSSRSLCGAGDYGFRRELKWRYYY